MRVLVLGAGVVGSATAYFLAQARHDVTLVEKATGPGREWSFANGGLLDASSITPWAGPSVPRMVWSTLAQDHAPYKVRHNFDPYMWVWGLQFLRNCRATTAKATTESLRDLAGYSLDVLRDVSSNEHLHCERRGKGIIHLFRTEQEFTNARRNLQPTETNRSVPIDIKGLLKLVPGLSGSKNTFAGGIHHQADETGDAHLFARGIAEAAQRCGAEMHFGEQAKHILMDGGQVIGVKTTLGAIYADAIVVSCGINSRKIIEPLGINLPIYPVKGYSVTVPTRDPKLLPPVALHDHVQRTVVLPLENRLRITGFAEFDGYSKRIDFRRAHYLLNTLQDLLPEVGYYRSPQIWTGLRPMTPDCKPILGESPIPGLYLNTGHGSHGWLLACGSAKVVSDIVSGRPPEVDLAGFSFGR